MSETIGQFGGSLNSAALPISATDVVPVEQNGVSKNTYVPNLLSALTGVPRIVYTLTLNSNIPSITVTGFTSGFYHAVLNVIGRGDTSAENVPLQIQFNADTGSNYDSSVGGAGTTNINASNLTAATAPANYPGHSQFIIPFFNNTQFYKSTICSVYNRSAGVNAVAITYGVWKSTAAIAEATVKVSTGNFVAGTFFSLALQ